MKNNNLNNKQIIIYEGSEGQPHLEVRIENETVWLTQAQLVELFQSSKANISEHIRHIFEEGELQRNSVIRKSRTTANGGKNYNVGYHNLDLTKLQQRMISNTPLQDNYFAIKQGKTNGNYFF